VRVPEKGTEGVRHWGEEWDRYEAVARKRIFGERSDRYEKASGLLGRRELLNREDEPPWESCFSFLRL